MKPDLVRCGPLSRVTAVPALRARKLRDKRNFRSGSETAKDFRDAVVPNMGSVWTGRQASVCGITSIPAWHPAHHRVQCIRPSEDNSFHEADDATR
jgi:hypothetical protein